MTARHPAIRRRIARAEALLRIAGLPEDLAPSVLKVCDSLGGSIYPAEVVRSFATLAKATP